MNQSDWTVVGMRLCGLLLLVKVLILDLPGLLLIGLRVSLSSVSEMVNLLVGRKMLERITLLEISKGFRALN